MIHMLIDGVAFQLKSPSAWHWRKVLERLAQQPQLMLSLLDRGDAPSVPRRC